MTYNTPNSGVDQMLCQGPNKDDPAPCISTPYDAVVSARSLHTGGVNVLMGDGSVHFISDSVSLEFWRAIGSMAGGETVDNEF